MLTLFLVRRRLVVSSRLVREDGSFKLMQRFPLSIKLIEVLTLRNWPLEVIERGVH